MLFSSTVFIFLFLPAVLIGYYLLLRGMKARNALLLAASLLFYAWGEPVYVLLMLLSIAVNYVFGRLLERRAHSKALLAAAVIFNLGLLFYFKYLNFTVDNLNALFGLHLSVPALALPIGISFFTFQAMSYVIDVYRGTAPVQCNVLSLGLYISFFPQLIAGPIVRYNSIAAQIEERRVAPEDFQAGVCRFIEGFAKKIILANNLSLAAEKAFALAGAGEISTAMAWLGSLAYTFQIFFDFSGYSDMAIGLGRMFGFRFEENFRYPYLSRSVSEFWNRWHISLGHWFRDYVYFPLGGSRVDKGKLLRNLFVVWLLTGVWHGAAWQFIVWGLGYGLIISLEKLTGFPRSCRSNILSAAYALCTFLIVNAGWVLFGAQDLPAALVQLRAMLGFGAAPDLTAAFYWQEYWPLFLAAAFFSTPLLRRLLARLRPGTALEIGRALLYMLLFVISVSSLAMGAHNPFIYFTF